MTTSEQMATIAMWMMIIGGLAGAAGLWTIFMSDGLDRGNLSKPMALVGLGLFFIGGFLKYRWGTYW
ncbi:MAG: hypothetical protein R3229_03605 [Alphaproteobacteria bacterium]|nr:hypothetical protein [Alphaproteobacteria bacterium]